MAVQIDIQIADDLNNSTDEPPSRALFTAWAQAAWQGEADASPLVSLRIVSANESQQLNNDYRGKNRPTNVLSFPMQLDTPIPSDQEAGEEYRMPGPFLGDLAICAEVVAREARQQHKTAVAHWAHMLVHGMLHLQGYDHIQDDEAEQMEQLEIRILQQLGFANPYQINTSIDTSMVESEK